MTIGFTCNQCCYLCTSASISWWSSARGATASADPYVQCMCRWNCTSVCISSPPGAWCCYETYTFSWVGPRPRLSWFERTSCWPTGCFWSDWNAFNAGLSYKCTYKAPPRILVHSKKPRVPFSLAVPLPLKIIIIICFWFLPFSSWSWSSSLTVLIEHFSMRGGGKKLILTKMSA